MYLKRMLAHLKNREWLCCFQGPVAYAHRQTSVALRAKTKQPYSRFSLGRPRSPRKIILGDLGIENGKLRMENY
jgi:hypothetical protein